MSDKTEVTSVNEIVFPDIADAPSARKSGVPSIRQIVLRGLKEKRSTASMAAVIQELHPDSAAAKKSAKHIAWYRGMVKKGAIKLPE